MRMEEQQHRERIAIVDKDNADDGDNQTTPMKIELMHKRLEKERERETSIKRNEHRMDISKKAEIKYYQYSPKKAGENLQTSEYVQKGCVNQVKSLNMDDFVDTYSNSDPNRANESFAQQKKPMWGSYENLSGRSKSRNRTKGYLNSESKNRTQDKKLYLSTLRVNQRIREGNQMIEDLKQPKNNASTTIRSPVKVGQKLITFDFPNYRNSSGQNSGRLEYKETIKPHRHVYSHLTTENSQEHNKDKYKSSTCVADNSYNQNSARDFPYLNTKLLSKAMKVHDMAKKYNIETKNHTLNSISQYPNRQVYQQCVDSHILNYDCPFSIDQTIGKLESARNEQIESSLVKKSMQNSPEKNMYANDNMHLTSSPERVNVGHLFTRSKEQDKLDAKSCRGQRISDRKVIISTPEPESSVIRTQMRDINADLYELERESDNVKITGYKNVASPSRSVLTNDKYWAEILITLQQLYKNIEGIKNRLAINQECSSANLFNILSNARPKYWTKRDYKKVQEFCGVTCDSLEMDLSFKQLDLDGDGLIYESDFVKFLEPKSMILKEINKSRRTLNDIGYLSLATLSNVTQLIRAVIEYTSLGNELRSERGIKRLFRDNKGNLLAKPSALVVRDCMRGKGYGLTHDEGLLIVDTIFKLR